MRTALLLTLAACGSPRQPTPHAAPGPSVCPRVVNGECYVSDELLVDAAVDAPADADIDADLAFLAVPDAAPEMTFADLGDMANSAVNVAVSRVTLDDPAGSEEAADGEPAETYENGVRVVFVNNRVWCATSGTEMCGVSEPSCRRVTGARCRLSPNRACTSATSRTDGTDNYVCFASYGACARFKAIASVEYDIDDCVVLRYRKGAK
jgi:hypothetical protein